MKENKAKFYTDAHIDFQVVKQLREYGADVVRCQDVGLADAKDWEHLTYAAQEERIVITCDKDFPDLHWAWMEQDKQHSGIIYCKQPELCTIKTILENALLIFEDPEGKEALRNDLWRVQK